MRFNGLGCAHFLGAVLLFSLIGLGGEKYLFSCGGKEQMNREGRKKDGGVNLEEGRRRRGGRAWGGRDNVSGSGTPLCVPSVSQR